MGYRSDRILIQPKGGVRGDVLARFHAGKGARVIRSFPDLDQAQVVTVPPGATVPGLIQAYQQSGLVERAEPDYWIHLATTPNDPRFVNGSQWNLHNTGQSGGTAGADISALGGWANIQSAENIIVAVIDTGIRYTHEDLAANMWRNPLESGTDSSGADKGTNGIDDANNGYVDDVHGINAITRTGDPMDDNGHGTHVAGIIGAVGNNGKGITGVAWNVQIMALKFMDRFGDGSISDAIRCINYARSNGAHIINASWGMPVYSAFLEAAIRAAGDAGILFVAAAGNEGANTDVTPFYPASLNLDNIVSVAATTRTDGLVGVSNFGARTVHLGAPGSTILSTYNSSDSSYTHLSGTSMAAPHVTGILALMRARYPDESHQQLISRLLAATDPLPSLAGKSVSGGRANLQRAVGASLNADFQAEPPSGDIPLTVQFTDESFGNAVSWHWDFGDGSTSSSRHPSHTFTLEGQFPVTLTVTDPDGNSSSKTRLISATANYKMRAATFNWIDPSGMREIRLSNNEVSSAQSLPFSFRFYGQTYNRIYVGANGILGFASAGLSSSQNTDLPHPGLPNAIICPWWDDLDPASGSVRFGTIGDAPKRRVIISWVNVRHRLNPPSFFTFQVVLYEGSNEILFQYLDVHASRNRGAGRTATIGIENETGSMARKYSYNGGALLANRQAILFSPTSGGGLVVSPLSGFASSGNQGGAFSPATQTYTLENTAESALNWAVEKTRPWLSISSTTGSLPPGSTTSIAVSINSEAGLLAAGSYSDSLSFVNLDTGAGNTTRAVTLAVNDDRPPFLEVSPEGDFHPSGPRAGPFNPANQIFTLMNTGGAQMDWTAEATVPWIVLSETSGALAAGEGFPLSVSIAAIATAELSASTYSGTVLFSNQANGQGNTERRVFLTIQGQPAFLTVSPEEPWEPSGFPGRKFEWEEMEYLLRNGGDDSLTWSVSDVPDWVDLSAETGQLGPAGGFTLIARLNEKIHELPPGAYPHSIQFMSSSGDGATPAAVVEREILFSVYRTASLSILQTVSGQIALRIEGEPGLFYQIETSTNLLDWMPWVYQEIPATGELILQDAVSIEHIQRFFRAIRQ